MNPLVDSFVQELLNGVEPAAIEAGLASKDIAIAAAHGFLQGKLGLIEDWINSLIDKSLSPDDFKQMAKDLGVNALEVCLKVAGLAEVEVDKTKNTILKIAVGAASSLVGKIVTA